MTLRASDLSPARLQWLGAMRAMPGIFLPIHTTTPGNNRKHWRTDAQAIRKAREQVDFALTCCRAIPTAFGDGLHVSLTRYSNRRLDGFGNLPSSFKAVADAIASH